ncbi:MAG: ArsR/SmtB family transcription factor [Akkermansiaceae bacterium]
MSIINSLKIISDPTRLRILHLLDDQELSVADLQEVLNMGQSRISTQLSQLRNEDLTTDRRVGKNNLYSASIPTNLTSIITAAAKELQETQQDKAALKHLLSKRRNKSKAYFDQLAGKFGKQYVPGRSWKALAEALLKILNYDTVADLGAGEGTLSQLLAQRAKKVIAIDSSEKMVEFGTKLAKEHDLPNLEYRQGDISAPPIDDTSVDLAIFSQALHHAERPAKALREALRILKPGGTLIVLDLLQHNFEQAKELYYDLHLGFSEVELFTIITQAGFHSIDVVIADKEPEPPHFQTLLAVARKP